MSEKIVRLTDSNNDTIYPIMPKLYKYMASASTETINLSRGIWLITTGRYNTTSNINLGLYIAVSRPDMATQRCVMKELEAPSGVTLSLDNDGTLTMTSTVTNIIVCCTPLFTY